MDLKTHYDQLYNKSIQTILTSGETVDHYIDQPIDHRYGLALIIRFDSTVIQAINNFTNQLKKIDPYQYYYPISDMHITILSIISCRDGFTLKEIEPDNYCAIIKKNIQTKSSFEINMEGITASTDCIMIQGFPANNSLNNLRNQLRKDFKSSDLIETLDQRYLLQTAHSTVVRFRQPIQNKEAFLKTIDDYRNISFGVLKVQDIHLVYNDWYHRNSKVKNLSNFTLL